ncbi:hypothetical protein [Pseudomonas shirazensis]
MKKNLFTKKGIVLMLFVAYFSSNINLINNSIKYNIDGKTAASTSSSKGAIRS